VFLAIKRLPLVGCTRSYGMLNAALRRLAIESLHRSEAPEIGIGNDLVWIISKV
jgi:hypothetical protein